MIDFKKKYQLTKKNIEFISNKALNIIKLSKTPYYSRLLSFKKYLKPLKRSKSGFEVEYILIDTKGKISYNSQEVISKINKKYPEIYVSKEVGKQMIEWHSFPSVKVQNTALDLIQNTIKILEISEKEGTMIYPFACYPGKFNLKMHDEPRYHIQSKIFGERRYMNTAGSLCGFHFHYTIPRGVFDSNKLFLKRLARSKIKHSFIDCYNMLIAIDPALITLMQSSPFVNNKYFAKDSRVIMYRGGKKLNYMDGLYARIQLLGGLQPYKHTIYDLKSSLRRKDKKWKELVEKSNFDAKTKKDVIKKKITLDYIWNPVKVNKIGTLEQRGMDTNYLSHAIASAVLIKYILRAIQQDFLVVLPSDIGINEPFKVEGGVIYIPPHSYVRNKLQKDAAYEGINNKKAYRHTLNFFRFAKKLMHNRYSTAIRPIEKMIDEKKTVSDLIIQKAKRSGYNLTEEIPDEFVKEFALYAANDFVKDVHRTEKVVANLD